MSWSRVEGINDVGIGISLDDVIRDINSTLEGLSIILDFFRGVVEGISALLGVSTDNFSAFVESLVLVLQNFRSLYASVSTSFLYHFPGAGNEKSFSPPNQVMYDVGMSYLDKADQNRPIAEVPVFGASVVFLWSFPSAEGLSEKLYNVKKAFNSIEPSIKNAKNSSISFPTELFLQGGADGMAPDWSGKLSLLQLNPVKNFDNKLSSYINDLKKDNYSRAQRIVRVLDLLQLKIENVIRLSEDLLVSLEGLVDLFNVGSGADVLVVKGTGSARDFATAIINSTSHIQYPSTSLGEGTNQASRLDQLSARLYSGALVVHLQSPTGDTITDQIETVLNYFVSNSENVDIIKGQK